MLKNNICWVHAYVTAVTAEHRNVRDDHMSDERLNICFKYLQLLVCSNRNLIIKIV